MKQDESDSANDGVQQCQVSSSGASLFSNYIVPKLFLEALDGFFFTVNAEGNVKFVSDNVANYLHYSPNELLDKNITSIVHIEDRRHFDQCLVILGSESCKKWFDSDLNNRTKSFFCRLRVRPDGSSSGPPEYTTMLIKVVPQMLNQDDEMSLLSHETSGGESNPYSLACIAERISPSMDKIPTRTDLEHFITKQDLSGKILDCHSSTVADVHGSIQSMIGCRIQDLCHNKDYDQLKRHYSEVMRNGSNLSGMYRFRMPAGHYVFVQTNSTLFSNGSSGAPQFVISKHSVMRQCDADSEQDESAWSCIIKALMSRSESGSLKAGARNASPFQLGAKSMSVAGEQFNLSAGFLESDGDNCLSNDVLMFDLPGSDKVSFNISELLEFVENQNDTGPSASAATAAIVSETGANLFDINMDALFSSASKMKDDGLPFNSIESDLSLSQFGLKDGLPGPNSNTIAGLQSPSGLCQRTASAGSAEMSSREFQSFVDDGQFRQRQHLGPKENLTFTSSGNSGDSKSSVSMSVSAAGTRGQILRAQLLQPVTTPAESDSSTRTWPGGSDGAASSGILRTLVANPNITWKVPQQPDQAKPAGRRNSQQGGNAGSPAVPSTSSAVRSPGSSGCTASPNSQNHVGLKDLLLSADSSSNSSDSILANIMRVSCNDNSQPPFMLQQQGAALIDSTSPASLITKHAILPQIEVGSRNSRPPLILKQLLEDHACLDGVTENSGVVSNFNTNVAVTASATLSGLTRMDSVYGNGQQINSNVGNTSSASVPKSFFDFTHMSPGPESTMNSEASTVLSSPSVHSPMVMAFSSLVTSGIITTAGSSSPVDSPAAVISRLMVATCTVSSLSTSSSSQATQNSAMPVTSSSAGPRNKSNYLLRQLLEKAPPSSQHQQLLPKLIDDLPTTSLSIHTTAANTVTTSSCSIAMSLSNSGLVVTGVNAASNSWKSGDADAMQRPAAKRMRFKSDELTAKLTEMWERGDTSLASPSVDFIHAGTKRKMSDTGSAGSSCLVLSRSSSVEGKTGGMLSQMLSATAVTVATSATLSLGSVATATPQMNIARNMSTFQVPVTVASTMLNSSVFCSSSIDSSAPKQRELPGSNSAIQAYLNSTSSIARSEANSISSSIADDDVLSLLNSTLPEMSSSAVSGSKDIDDVALLMQLEQILSEPSLSLSDIDSVLENGVIGSQDSTGAIGQSQQTESSKTYGDGNLSEPCSVTDVEEQQAIRAIRSQLMFEAASIRPPSVHQPKLLGHLLSRDDSTSLSNLLSNDVNKRQRTQASTLPSYGPPSYSSVMASNTGLGSVSTPLATVASSSSCNSPIDVMAVIQRATAEAAALSNRHTAVSGGSGVAQKVAIPKQSSLNFNTETPSWMNLNDMLNVSFAPNVTIERDPSGAMVTSVRHQSTVASPFNIQIISSTSSATRSLGSLPVPSASVTLTSGGLPMPNSPIRPPTTRLVGPSAQQSTNKQPILGSLLSSTGPSTPPPQLQPRVPVTGPQLFTSSGQLTPGTSLPFLTSTVTTASHTTATLGQVVRPVLAAVLRPQTGGGVQLVLNQQSNAAFMTGGVIVQGDLLNKLGGLTAVRPAVSAANGSLVLASAGDATGSNNGQVTVRLVAPGVTDSSAPVAVRLLGPTGNVSGSPNGPVAVRVLGPACDATSGQLNGPIAVRLIQQQPTVSALATATTANVVVTSPTVGQYVQISFGRTPLTTLAATTQQPVGIITSMAAPPQMCGVVKPVRFIVSEMGAKPPPSSSVVSRASVSSPVQARPLLLSSIRSRQENVSKVELASVLSQATSAISASVTNLNPTMLLSSLTQSGDKDTLFTAPSNVPPADLDGIGLLDSGSDIEGELPFDVLQSIKELAKDQSMGQRAGEHDLERPPSGIGSNSADMQKAAIESWLQQASPHSGHLSQGQFDGVMAPQEMAMGPSGFPIQHNQKDRMLNRQHSTMTSVTQANQLASQLSEPRLNFGNPTQIVNLPPVQPSGMKQVPNQVQAQSVSRTVVRPNNVNMKQMQQTVVSSRLHSPAAGDVSHGHQYINLHSQLVSVPGSVGNRVLSGTSSSAGNVRRTSSVGSAIGSMGTAANVPDSGPASVHSFSPITELQQRSPAGGMLSPAVASLKQQDNVAAVNSESRNLLSDILSASTSSRATLDTSWLNCHSQQQPISSPMSADAASVSGPAPADRIHRSQSLLQQLLSD